MTTAKRKLGLLTAGGDCQGLNAALRAVTLASTCRGDAEVIGFLDGFHGLREGRCRALSPETVSGILPLGGTILGTGRGSGGARPSLDEAIGRCLATAQRLALDTLICLGGDGTHRFATKLADAGLKVITLPKTIDNDIRGTDVSFGYATATLVASEAIDRLHSTTDSHHRIMLVEVMGRDAGWLAAAGGLAGGADLVLLPEIPYSIDSVVASIADRSQRGRHYSMVVIAEGAYSREEAATPGFVPRKHAAALRLVDQLPELTGIQTRLTTLGYVMRGGSPSPSDRILATQLGVTAADLAAEGVHGVMVAKRGADLTPVPLAEVAGPPRVLPLDHPLIHSLRSLGVGLGD